MNESTDAVLACRNLARTFVDESINVEVLRGINLSISPGEQIAIIGSSGSGKSTLMHLLGGLDTPTSGEVLIDGQTISTLSPAVRGRLRNEKLGFVYQFHHLLPEFTALENVAMPLLIRRIAQRDALTQAEEMLVRVGLGERHAHKPGELSGGERQRAAIARALVTRPRCVLADEPTGNLDRRTADVIYELMLELNQTAGTALVIVTHDLALAERTDRVLSMTDGQLNQSEG
ncbi:MAG: lipoprotein-releasing ABC transporter ATP-binding protein LolD [Pseudomonadota bacterium]